jgi:hypothetical protein
MNMDKKTKASVQELVDYLYADEMRHWQESDRPALHIFHDITRVAEWLDKAAH